MDPAKWGLSCLLAAVLFAGAARTGEPQDMAYPQLSLSGGGLRLTVYLPDAVKGYYRAARFDWSGQIGQIEYQGHTFCGPFRTTPHDPVNHENTQGPVEEFGMEQPLGYDAAPTSGVFIKIGVGLLKKDAEAKYCFWKPYPVVQPGAWKITHGEDWVEFAQDLQHDGYGYRYTKRIAIEPGAPAFTVAHTLRNTGAKLLGSNHYCHNFSIIDGAPIGPDYRLTFGFDCGIKKKDGPLKIAVKDRQLAFLEPIPEHGAVWVQLSGAAGTVEENRITVENTRTGAGVKISGDQPAIKYVVYAEKTAVCPEPFIQLELAPGEEKSWRNKYDFFLRESGK